MRVDKLSVSFPAQLGDAVRSAATSGGTPLSTWLAEAAASRLRRDALTDYLVVWEGDNGALTDGELAVARRELGMDPALGNG